MKRSLLGWLDNSAYQGAAESDSSDRVDWIRTAPFWAMHIACLAVLWVGWSPVAVGVAIALYFVRMFAITGFYHRYFSHRTFKTSRWFQFVMAVWGNTSCQRGPLWWAAHHRHHHRHSDQEDDVHSPHQHGLLWSHMLWITTPRNFATDMKQVKDLTKYPELLWLDRYDWVVPVVFAGAMFGLGAGLNALAPGLGTSGLQMLVWGFFVSTVVLFHGTCLINSLAHMIGKKRFDTDDHSRNSLLLAFITLGEGWHNNHHHYPAATRQGFYWWEFDPTYYTLKLLSFAGLISELKPVPERILEEGLSARRRVAAGSEVLQ
ncbi:acyl-CoA desaturase [bacterium]|nr:acyl-CoA desaturase [bacterium]